MNTELLRLLGDLRNGLFQNAEAVNAVLDECIKLAGEQQAAEPVAWMEATGRRNLCGCRAKELHPGTFADFTIPLFAHPPKDQPKALTVDRVMEEITEVLDEHGLESDGNANVELHRDIRSRLSALSPSKEGGE